MKNVTKLLWITVLMAIIGFSFVACGGGGDHPTIIPHTHNWNLETGVCSGCTDLYYSIGDTGPGGGKIFYRSATSFDGGRHYLEADLANIAGDKEWASSSPTDYTNTLISGTFGIVIGTGRTNTALILGTDANAPAAKACYASSSGGKGDWFLPSKDELNELYKWYVAGGKGTFGNLNTDYYWTSTQLTAAAANDQSFFDGSQRTGGGQKSNPAAVRAVRSF